MHISYFYATAFTEALAALPSGVELVDTSAGPFSYWNAIAARWNEVDDDLVFIEQDIVIHNGVVSGFEACDKPRCMFPYLYGSGKIINTNGSNFITGSLGCTKFSREIQRTLSIQEIFDYSKDLEHSDPDLSRVLCEKCSDRAICWVHIDEAFNLKFRALGDDGHQHGPFVENLHFAYL